MRFCSLEILLRIRRRGVVSGLVVLSLLIVTGCQNRPRLFNFGRTDRVPPPATNTLNIPQFNPVLGSPPTSNMGMPYTTPVGGSSSGAFYPTGNPISNPGVANPAMGTPTVPGIGVSPWNSPANGAATGINPGTGAPIYTQIPDRGSATGVPGSTMTGNPMLGGSVTGVDRTNVPALLPGGFDPYDTSRVPTWSNAGGTGFNALGTTSSPTVPPGAQVGFWPGQTQTPGSPGNTGFGSGQWLRRVFGGSRLQPANLTGYATTAPIDNPMIPVTPGVGYAPQTMPGNYGVQPAAFVAQPSATPGNGLSYARWREMQAAGLAQAQQQAAWQQAQLWNQQMAQAAALRSGPGASSYQVLAENSTSRTAENQTRFGLSAPAVAPVNPNYGAPPVAGAAGQMQSGQAPPMFRSAGQPMRAADNSGLQTGWQSSGVR
jgi:hypothetical protein